MRGVNKAIIVGTAGKDPEVHYTASGKAITNISLATNEEWKDKQTGEKQSRTEWHRVVFFGKLAEIAGEYIKKGAQVYIEGKITTRKWQDKDGQTRYSTEIVVDGYAGVMQMIGGRSDDQGATQTQKPEPDKPAQSGFKQGGFREEAKDADKDDFEDDDIPFR